MVVENAPPSPFRQAIIRRGHKFPTVTAKYLTPPRRRIILSFLSELRLPADPPAVVITRHERAQKRDRPHRPSAPPRRKTRSRQSPRSGHDQSPAQTPSHHRRHTADHARSAQTRYATRARNRQCAATTQTFQHARHAQAGRASSAFDARSARRAAGTTKTSRYRTHSGTEASHRRSSTGAQASYRRSPRRTKASDGRRCPSCPCSRSSTETCRASRCCAESHRAHNPRSRRRAETSGASCTFRHHRTQASHSCRNHRTGQTRRAVPRCCTQSSCAVGTPSAKTADACRTLGRRTTARRTCCSGSS